MTIHFGPPAGVILTSETTRDLHFVGMPPGTVLLTPMSVKIQRQRKRPWQQNDVSRKGLPCTAAFACTDYKVQGRSLDRVALELRGTRTTNIGGRVVPAQCDPYSLAREGSRGEPSAARNDSRPGETRGVERQDATRGAGLVERRTLNQQRKSPSGKGRGPSLAGEAANQPQRSFPGPGWAWGRAGIGRHRAQKAETGARMNTKAARRTARRTAAGREPQNGDESPEFRPMRRRKKGTNRKGFRGAEGKAREARAGGT
ncbi:hypothetical protein Purlil1_14214 [Purpureocillium lilacinum]|uniref:Uncharacterized protein n=1 Tax=Purpureocillium lilacinum TaxID=33203 RepID=A0ABR0BBV8_PURLI|nr:hypothetical protein Purlil1_14214 [Purpureocillium lilacinum]